MENDGQFNQQEIDDILKKYKAQKEYRRVYYNAKYKNDVEYQFYIRDYNKFRYEHIKCQTKINNGEDPIQCELVKAIKLRDWYIRTERPELFLTKYPKENNLLCINASQVPKS